MDAIYQFRRWVVSPLAFFVIVLASGCGDRLEEYVSDEGKFRVRMPGQPKLNRDPDLPKSIRKVSLVQQSGVYEVAWQDLPPEKDRDAELRLDKACNGALRSLKAKEISRKPITLVGGHAGRELVAEWPDGYGLVHDRMYLVENRLYQVVASGPKWWVESSTTRKVLDSFAVVED